MHVKEEWFIKWSDERRDNQDQHRDVIDNTIISCEEGIRIQPFYCKQGPGLFSSKNVGDRWSEEPGLT
jgi:hypothetical protein